MVIDNKYTFGDIVYLATDVDQSPRIVTEVIVAKDSILYELSCGERCSNHYDIEITSEKNVLLSVSN